MGYHDTITHRARELIARHDTRDPFAIARALGIEIKYTDRFRRLKGMYFLIGNTRFIALNSDNSPQMNRIVCAHELGHDQLHREFARAAAIQEFMLYDMATRPEYEANIFAASLLLDDETVLDHVAHGYDSQHIAAAMETDINLVALKIDCLIRDGYRLQEQGHNTTFLK